MCQKIALYRGWRAFSTSPTAQCLTIPTINRRSGHGLQQAQIGGRPSAGRRAEAAARRATERLILEEAEQLATAWNERQAKRIPMLFSPTIGAAITAGYWFLRARCPACRPTGDVDLRALDWHRGADAAYAVVVSFMLAECAFRRAQG